MVSSFNDVALPSGDQSWVEQVTIHVPDGQVVGVNVRSAPNDDWAFLVVLVILTRGHWVLNLGAVANATDQGLLEACHLDSSVLGKERFASPHLPQGVIVGAVSATFSILALLLLEGLEKLGSFLD